MRTIKALAALVLGIVLALPFAGCSSQAGAHSAAQNTARPLWAAGEERNKIVVVSDLHLGIDDAYTETLANRPLLVEFLQRLQSTKDARELIIAGDFLDEWFLPVSYPPFADETQFYKDVIANNHDVIRELNNVADSGITLVYVIGNHDMMLEAKVLQEAIPGIRQMRDARGLGYYYAGDRHEIVVEHGHRYDVFSAPDTVTNAQLCGNDDTIFPAGYFYARYAATWVLEGRPHVEKNLPVVRNVPERTDTDFLDASSIPNVTILRADSSPWNIFLFLVILRSDAFNDSIVFVVYITLLRRLLRPQASLILLRHRVPVWWIVCLW